MSSNAITSTVNSIVHSVKNADSAKLSPHGLALLQHVQSLAREIKSRPDMTRADVDALVRQWDLVGKSGDAIAALMPAPAQEPKAPAKPKTEPKAEPKAPAKPAPKATPKAKATTGKSRSARKRAASKPAQEPKAPETGETMLVNGKLHVFVNGTLYPVVVAS